MRLAAIRGSRQVPLGARRWFTSPLLGGMSLVLLFVGCANSSNGPTAQTDPSLKPTATETSEPIPDGDDWTQYRYDLTGTGYNPEGYITSATSSQLNLAWTAQSGAFLSTPAIVHGVVYVVTHETLQAYDLLTGALKWKSKDLAEGVAVNSSVAVDTLHHLAFFGTASARVVAIDIDTGAIVWNVQLADPTAGAYIWGTPLLANNKLYIGMASHQDNPCVRGAIYALDLMTGVLAWTHYTVPTGMLGGAVWSSMTADPATHQLIVTTGNPCPQGNVTYESDAILSLDWNSGATLWLYTALASDNCDCDFGEGAVIYTLHGQQYIVAGNKYGAIYAVKPPVGNGPPMLAWTAQIANPGFLYVGGVFQPPAYHDGLVFMAFGPTLDGKCTGGALVAFHGDTGNQAWEVCTPSQAVGSGAISGDLLFIPFINQLIAYQTISGKVIWSAKQSGETWGGVAISRGYVVSGTLAKVLYCYGLPLAGRHAQP